MSYSPTLKEKNIDSQSFVQLYDSIDSKQAQVLLDEYNKYITPYKNYCKHCEKFYEGKYDKCPSDNNHLMYKSSRKYEECTRCNMLTDIYTPSTKVCRWCNSYYFKINDDEDDSSEDEELTYEILQQKKSDEKIRFQSLNDSIRHLKSRYASPFRMRVHLLQKDYKYINDGTAGTKMQKSAINNSITVDTLKSIQLYDDCVKRHQDEKKLRKCDIFDENSFIELSMRILKEKKAELKELKQNKNNEYPLFMKKIDVEASTEFIIMGDIHCDLESFVTILIDLKEKKIIDNDFRILHHEFKKYKIIFLGDMVDYGFYGMEVLSLVFMLKSRNYKDVFILNGNHEDVAFHDCYNGRCKEFGYEKKVKIKNPKTKLLIDQLLNTLPCVMFIRYKSDPEQKYFQLCHGGIDHFVSNLQLFLHDSTKNVINISYKNKMYIYPDNEEYMYSGFKWSDFTNFIDTYARSSRGGNLYTFGYDMTEKYLRNVGLHSIISGHQDQTSFGALLNTHQKTSEHFVLHDYVRMKNASVPLYELYNLKRNSHFDLKPNVDFLACVTSTAISAKNIERNIENEYQTTTKKGMFTITSTEINENENYYLSKHSIPSPTYLSLSFDNKHQN